ncbi:G-protein coupled receptor 1 [Mactra antiquata]
MAQAMSTALGDIHSENETMSRMNSTRLDNSQIPGYDPAFATIINVEKFCTPLICVCGLIGNTLSTITFLRNPLRRAPCSLYLASRGISDNGFLLSLLMTWVSSTFDLRLSQVKGVCQCIIFMTYLCGCVSVWLCVFITFENFLLIQTPFIARRVCCNNVSKTCITILVVTAIVIYNTSLWIINEDCTHNPSYSSLTQVLVYSDTLLTLVIPTVIIFVLLSVIAYKLIRIYHIRRLHANMIAKLTDRQNNKPPIIPLAKVTRMLFVVSFTFFILNVPSHVIRLSLLIGSFTKGNTTAPFVQATIQTTFQLIYYLSFSVNLGVYAAFGSNFRKVFKETFCSSYLQARPVYVPTEAVNLVRHRSHSMNNDEPNDVTSLMIDKNGIRPFYNR